MAQRYKKFGKRMALSIIFFKFAVQYDTLIIKHYKSNIKSKHYEKVFC